MIEKARTDIGGNARIAWEALRDEAAACTRCHLYKHATQTVFGEGEVSARLMFVGEQPGDQEDLAGKPFVGPAGQVFNQALAQAGIDRSITYVTNAVKHFKFEQRGKRRIHSRANAVEQRACRPWLERELALLRPRVIVCLGATAATALMGRDFGLMRERGVWHEGPGGIPLLSTVHPSWVLRQPPEAGPGPYDGFVADLARVAQQAAATDGAAPVALRS
jgi:DNA polymerase